MPASWPPDLTTRWSRLFLRAASVFVPSEVRPEWLSEWEAELWQLRTGGSRAYELVLFLGGAAWDGVSEWKEGWRMDSILQDIRFTGRTLSRSPGFTVAAVLTLTLSIGASTSLFTLVEAALLAEPPYPEPDRLVVVDMLFGMPGQGQLNPSTWSYPRYQALRDEVTTIDDLAGYESRTMTLTGRGDPEVITVEVATPSLFALLGISSTRGRIFGPEEEDQGPPAMLAVVGHSFWQTRMGRAPGAVGSTIELDGLTFEVVGVLAEGFDGVTGGAEAWLPMSALREVLDATALEDPWNQHFNVMGRLAPGASLEQARSEVAAFGSTVMDRYPPPAGASRMVSGGDVVPYMEARQNGTTTASMLALFASVILLLAIATANLAGLLLARSTARQREAAVRASLGAGRGRLTRQMLTESLVLSAIGGALGLGLATVGVGYLGTWLTDVLGTTGERGLEFLDSEALAINWRVLLFATGTTGAVGIAFGLLPAWQVSRSDPATLLKGGAGLGARPSRFGLSGRNGLIVGQVALALLLLSGASLMFRSMTAMQRLDLGFDRDNLLTAMYTLTPADEQAGIDPETFHIEVLERIRSLPGVVSASLGEVPMGGPTQRTIVLSSEGRPELSAGEHLWIRMQAVADGHLGMMGAELIEGRDIERTDEWSSERVIVLGRAAAEELFPEGSPLGQLVSFGWPGFSSTGARVVGVVDDIQFGLPGQPLEREGFVSLRQAPQLATGVLIRTIGSPEAMAPLVRAEVAAVAPKLALTGVMSMEARERSMTIRPRVLTAVLGFFGFVALLLVAVGLYGTIAYTVTSRTQELGLRASLGANKTSLVTLVLRQGLTVTLAGIILGSAGSVWASRFLRTLIVEVPSFDPVGLATAAATLFAVALVAAYLPARRGMRADPMAALRSD